MAKGKGVGQGPGAEQQDKDEGKRWWGGGLGEGQLGRCLGKEGTGFVT